MAKLVVGLILLFALLIAIFAIQWRRIVMADCTVRVIAADGNPVGDIRVSESWYALSYGLRGGGDLRTNSAGVVHFDSKVEEHSLLFWALRPLVTLMDLGVHASFGSYANVHISEPGFTPGPTQSFSCAEKECTEHPLLLEFRVAQRVPASPE